MASLNKVILIGNLGRDPNVHASGNGEKIVDFSLATTERWGGRDGGEKQEKTEWHRIVVFGKLAETASKYLKKGRCVFVEGRLQTREWTDKSGAKRYTTEIVASNFQFLDSAQGQGQTRDVFGGSSGSQMQSPQPMQTAQPQQSYQQQKPMAFGGSGSMNERPDFGEPPDIPF